MLAKSLTEIVEYVEKTVINPFIVFLIALAGLVFVWGMIEFLSNAGDSAAQSEGKRKIIWGIVGMTIMVSAFGIINLVGSIFQ